MNIYQNAEKWSISAVNSLNSGDYQASVFSSCLSVELFLKSKVVSIDPDSDLEKSHDTIAMYTLLNKKYPSKVDLRRRVAECRKYFNESRYPFGDDSIYTEEFAKQFIEHIGSVKNYIDEECLTSLEELQGKYKKS